MDLEARHGAAGHHGGSQQHQCDAVALLRLEDGMLVPVAESELFGHLRGAFTGATRDRGGKFELADGGSLFLDEVGELSPPVQAKLLRVLQTGEVQRLGSDALHHVDVRVIAATNRDLKAEVLAGRFRQDLFQRLAAYPIAVPPLAQRDDDVELLAGHFLERIRRRLGLGAVSLGRDAVSALHRYDWPGNVRELEHVLDRAVLRARAERPGTALVLGAADLDLLPVPTSTPAAGNRVPPPQPLNEAVQAFQRERIREALVQSKGNWARAARELGLDRSNLHRLGRRLGVSA